MTSECTELNCKDVTSLECGPYSSTLSQKIKEHLYSPKKMKKLNPCKLCKPTLSTTNTGSTF